MSQDSQIRQTVVLANLVGQIGCVTGLMAIVIIAIAFGAGWLLDSWMGNERRIITVLFMLGSFPVTLFAIVRISLLLLQRAQSRLAETQDAPDK
jgi:hypothetical protein